MMLPPAIISVTISNEPHHRFRLWLPVIILWPLLIIAAAILFPLAAIAEVFLAVKGIRPFSVLVALSGVITGLHGTHIDVSLHKSGKLERVKINIQ